MKETGTSNKRKMKMKFLEIRLEVIRRALGAMLDEKTKID